MTYDLYIADRMYSSWSLRGWLMFEAFGLPYRSHMLRLYGGDLAADLAPLAPAQTVPSVRLPEGTVISESLAIAETLHERHPDAGLWPRDPSARATARWLAAEMAAGFHALRRECPMQLGAVHVGFAPSEAVQSDIARIETLWSHARGQAGDGSWLFGAYSLADVFYAPVCARIVGYDLPVGDAARAYCLATLAEPSFQRWRAAALEEHYDPVPYDLGLPTRPWPGQNF